MVINSKSIFLFIMMKISAVFLHKLDQAFITVNFQA